MGNSVQVNNIIDVSRHNEECQKHRLLSYDEKIKAHLDQADQKAINKYNQ